jgi:hypothetical protein
MKKRRHLGEWNASHQFDLAPVIERRDRGTDQYAIALASYTPNDFELSFFEGRFDAPTFNGAAIDRGLMQDEGSGKAGVFR